MKNASLSGAGPAIRLAAAVLTCAIALAPMIPGATAEARAAQPANAALEAAINSPTRSAHDKARDRYRHPLKTLTFFGIKPDMTVVEIWPGGGWYTAILAPYLKPHGKLYEAVPPGPRSDKFRHKMAADPKLYGKVVITELGPPDHFDIAPPDSADMVLTFRNAHDWFRNDSTAEMFKAMYRALKPGGILGVVDHRGNPNLPQDPKAASGYVRQDYMIKLVEGVGFKLVGTSEINANPNDDRNHPAGVWTLPPTLRLGKVDRAKYLAIGESDRMTLKFVKPAK